MNDEDVKREFTKEELAAISARMRAQITADEIVDIINGFSGPTTPIESLLNKVSDYVSSQQLREGVVDGR